MNRHQGHRLIQTVSSLRARNGGAGRCRLRGQAGVSLIEVLFGTMILGMLAAPLVGLTLLTFRTEVSVGNRNEAADAIGMLKSYLQRDVGSAAVIDTSPTDPEILKCLGGPADNNPTRLLTVQYPREVVDPTATPPLTRIVQVDYNLARAVDGSGNVIPGEFSIWRQACDGDDTSPHHRDLIGGASQVVRSVVDPNPFVEDTPGQDPVRCIGAAGTFSDNICPTVQMKITPLAEGAIEQTISATSRLVTSSGAGQPLDVGDIPLEIKATLTSGDPLTGQEPPGTQVAFSAQFTYTDPVTYAWSMPTGADPKTPGWTSASAGGTFQFDTAGRYPIFLYIYDTANPGHYGTASLSIVIGDKPPVVVVNCGAGTYTDPGAEPCNLMRGSRVLRALDSYDPEGDSVTISWESADLVGGGYDPTVHVRTTYANGASIPETSPDRLHCDPLQGDTGCGAVAQVLFNAPGSRSVRVTATDANGLSTSLLVPLFVVTQPPTVTLTAQTTPRVPQTGGNVTFKAVANLPSPYGPNDKYPWARQILWEIEDANGAIVTPAPTPNDLGEPPPYTSYAPQTLTQRTVTRTLSFSGPFPMKLKAFVASDGGETSVAEVFTIRANTDPNPSANFSFTSTDASGGYFTSWNVAFTSTSTDDVMPIPTQQWSFAGPFTSSFPTGNGNTFNANGIKPGNHPVKLFVRDATNRTDEITKTVPLPGTPPKPTGQSRTTISPTEGSYTWDGVPGADGYEFEIKYRNDQHVYVNAESKFVPQPASAAGTTITATVQNTENNCSVANACYSWRMRSYFVIDGVTYASPWTSTGWW